MRSSNELPNDLPQKGSVQTASEAASLESCDRFLDRVEEIWLQNPQTALGLAERGLELAAGLATAAASRIERDARKARALGVLGGVHRSLGRHAEAEAAYHLAAELLLTQGDPLASADLARRLATLRRDQQRFEEARHLAEWALGCYDREGHRCGVARTLVELGIVLGHGYRELEPALRCFRRALEHLDPQSDPTYYRCAVHNLANALCRGDDPRRLAELEDWLARSRALGGFETGSPGALNTRWLEGLAAAHRGETARAETALEQARSGFVRLGLAADAAAAAMDLARLYLESGRVGEARRLAGELFPTFHALRSQRELTAVLNLYVNAAMLDRLSLELVRKVRSGIAAVDWLPAPPG